jgi:iron complex transport system permease protein
MGLKYASILGLLLLLTLLTLGYPHGEDAWFSFLGKDPIAWKVFTIYRLPEVFICIVAGFSLSVAGLMLQTVLNNPLAGPSILGISSGSHLMVAITLMGSSLLNFELFDVGITVAATIGALLFGVLILLISIRVRSVVSLLLIGIMLGSFVSAITSVLITKAEATSVKAFSIWSMGTIHQTSLDQIPFISTVFITGILLALLFAKPLNALVLGENSAKILGVNVQQTRWKIILIVSLLTGLVTAYCGPIGFVGLIVPNLIRLFYRTANHVHLLLASGIFGACVMLFCALLIRVFEPIIVLPINSLTSLLGAPIVLLLIVKNLKHA